MDDASLAPLEDLVINKYEEAKAVQEWLSDKECRALADSWLS